MIEKNITSAGFNLEGRAPHSGARFARSSMGSEAAGLKGETKKVPLGAQKRGGFAHRQFEGPWTVGERSFSALEPRLAGCQRAESESNRASGRGAGGGGPTPAAKEATCQGALGPERARGGVNPRRGSPRGVRPLDRHFRGAHSSSDPALAPRWVGPRRRLEERRGACAPDSPRSGRERSEVHVLLRGRRNWPAGHHEFMAMATQNVFFNQPSQSPSTDSVVDETSGGRAAISASVTAKRL